MASVKGTFTSGLEITKDMGDELDTGVSNKLVCGISVCSQTHEINKTIINMKNIGNLADFINRRIQQKHRNENVKENRNVGVF